MRIAVILPSRGLIFSETIEEVLREVAPFDYTLFFSHAKPIPQCFNEPLNEILYGDYTLLGGDDFYIWIVEEDMVLPIGILQELIDLDVPIATSDYPPVEGKKCVERDNDGKVLYTGTGCLLIKREVFRGMSNPIFTTENIYTPEGKYIGKRDPREKVYGQHDVHFFLQVRERGIPIGVTKSECHQRKIVEYGAKEVNDGFHKIKII